MEDYLDLFDLAAHQIHQGLQASSAKEHGKMNRILIGTVPCCACTSSRTRGALLTLGPVAMCSALDKETESFSSDFP